MKPRLLDLFCGAGGCARGYADAGFEVVGVDIADQPHYPYTFIKADALSFPLDGFDVIHASPPCQEYSRSRHIRDATTPDIQHKPQLIQVVRVRLEQSALPWVIENVEDAPLPEALELCGSMFGLNTRRHRWFSSSILLFAPGPCRHTPGFVNPVGGKVRGYGALRHPTRTYLDKSGRTRRAESSMARAAGCEAIGVDWMTIAEMSQAIPPAYTRWIGLQLMDYLKTESQVPA